MLSTPFQSHTGDTYGEPYTATGRPPPPPPPSPYPYTPSDPVLHSSSLGYGRPPRARSSFNHANVTSSGYRAVQGALNTPIHGGAHATGTNATTMLGSRSNVVTPSTELADRLQKLEDRINQHSATNADISNSSGDVEHSYSQHRKPQEVSTYQTQGGITREQHRHTSYEENQHRHAPFEENSGGVDSGNGDALRNLLLLQEKDLELGHRDVLLRRARAALTSSQKELDSLKHVENVNRQLECDLSDVIHERDGLSAGLQAAQKQHLERIEALGSEINDLRERKDRVEAALEEERRMSESLRGKLDVCEKGAQSHNQAAVRFQSMYEEAQEIIVELQQEVRAKAKLEEELLRARADAAARSDELARTERRYTSAESEIESLKTQLSALQTSKAHAMRQLEEAMGEVAGNRRIQIQLENALDRAEKSAERSEVAARTAQETLDKRTQEYVTHTAQKEQECIELKHRVKSLEKALEEANAHAEAEKHALHMHESDVRRTLEKLSREKEEAFIELQSLGKELSSRTEEVSTLSSVKEQLSQELTSAKKTMRDVTKRTETALESAQQAEESREREREKRLAAEASVSAAEVAAEASRREANFNLQSMQTAQSTLYKTLQKVEYACTLYLDGIDPLSRANVGESHAHFDVENDTIHESIYMNNSSIGGNRDVETIRESTAWKGVLEKIMRRLAGAQNLKKYFADAASKIQAKAAAEVEGIKKEWESCQARLRMAEQAVVLVKEEVRFSVKRAVMEEKERVQGEIERLLGERRDLAARLKAAEVGVGQMEGRGKHIRDAAEAAMNKLRLDLEAAAEKLHKEQQKAVALTTKFDRAIQEELSRREHCEGELGRLHAHIAEMNKKCELLAQEKLEAEKAKDKAIKDRDRGRERMLAMEATAGALRAEAAAAQKAAQASEVRHTYESALEDLIASEVRQTRDLLRSSREELSSPPPEKFLNGTLRETPDTSALPLHIEKLVTLSEDLEALVMHTSELVNEYASLRAGEGGEHPDDAVKQLGTECYELLDCNAQLSLHVQSFGLDLLRWSRKAQPSASETSRDTIRTPTSPREHPKRPNDARDTPREPPKIPRARRDVPPPRGTISGNSPVPLHGNFYPPPKGFSNSQSFQMGADSPGLSLDNDSHSHIDDNGTQHSQSDMNGVGSRSMNNSAAYVQDRYIHREREEEHPRGENTSIRYFNSNTLDRSNNSVTYRQGREDSSSDRRYQNRRLWQRNT